MLIFPLNSAALSTNRFADCLVIFLGLDSLDAAAVNDAYFRWSHTNVMPPTTLIIGRYDMLIEFQEQNPPDRRGHFPGLDRLYRHGTESSVAFCGFAGNGAINAISPRGTVGEDLAEVVTYAVECFVNQQIEEVDVVIPAPPETFFEKLSGRFSSHFIRTEALLYSTSAMELLALRLLKPFADWFGSYLVNSVGATIYIDTMSIWPLAEKLCQLHQVGRAETPNYQIESFRSYEGLPSWDPAPRPAFVLISASTSGGLAQKVREKLAPAKAEVWTIITLADDQSATLNSDNAMKIVTLPRLLTGRAALDGLRSHFQPDISTLSPGTETISIVGERFLSQPARPKRVRLVASVLDAATKKALASIARENVVRAARGRFDAHRRWALSFDFSVLFAMASKPAGQGRDSLLRSWLRNYSAPSPIAVIYPSSEGASATPVGNAALNLAQQTEDVLRELMPGAEIFILSSNELVSSSTEVRYDLARCSVIAVAPVLGNGFVFKQISALLRHRQPTGPRLFLALAALPETQQHFNQLKSDISGLNLDDRRYEFKCQFVLPVGRLDGAVQWADELDVLQDLSDFLLLSTDSEPTIARRIRALEDLTVLEDNAVFLPSPLGKPLALSTGFFLWENSTNIEGENFGAAVLLSIAALLQGARVAATKADATSLRTGLFQHALICPETFTRFNDSVIQAAVLRAAYPSELNYSVSDEMSYDMERLILKWIQYYDHPVGAAAGEFLLALAIGKLKLRRGHLVNVLTSARAVPGWLGSLAEIAARRLGVALVAEESRV